MAAGNDITAPLATAVDYAAAIQPQGTLNALIPPQTWANRALTYQVPNEIAVEQFFGGWQDQARRKETHTQYSRIPSSIPVGGAVRFNQKMGWNVARPTDANTAQARWPDGYLYTENGPNPTSTAVTAGKSNPGFLTAIGPWQTKDSVVQEDAVSWFVNEDSNPDHSLNLHEDVSRYPAVIREQFSRKIAFGALNEGLVISGGSNTSLNHYAVRVAPDTQFHSGTNDYDSRLSYGSGAVGNTARPLNLAHLMALNAGFTRKSNSQRNGVNVIFGRNDDFVGLASSRDVRNKDWGDIPDRYRMLNGRAAVAEGAMAGRYMPASYGLSEMLFVAFDDMPNGFSGYYTGTGTQSATRYSLLYSAFANGGLKFVKIAGRPQNRVRIVPRPEDNGYLYQQFLQGGCIAIGAYCGAISCLQADSSGATGANLQTATLTAGDYPLT